MQSLKSDFSDLSGIKYSSTKEIVNNYRVVEYSELQGTAKFKTLKNIINKRHIWIRENNVS